MSRTGAEVRRARRLVRTAGTRPVDARARRRGKECRCGILSGDMARILVADDEPGLREFIIDSLELDHHSVVPARDGREAAKLLDERGFDLVLTDLKMPGL